MSIGIYKITSLSGKIYIGQSNNIENRFKQYSKFKNIKNQIGLYNSFLKYGYINHKFEIIEECKIEDLNIRERFWQDYYNVLKEGLNCILTNTDKLPQIFSRESKLKKSNSMKKYYKKNPKKYKPIYQYDLNGNFIKKWDDIRESNFNINYILNCINGNVNKAYNYLWLFEKKIFNNEYINSINLDKRKGNQFNIGKKHSKKSNKIRNEKLKGKKRTNEFRKKLSKIKKKKVFQYTKDMEFIKEWESTIDINSVLKIHNSNIAACCRGKLKSAGGYIWRYKNNN